MNRLLVTLCYALPLGGLFWFFPLFHVVRNDAVNPQNQEPGFHAAEFVQSFWRTSLIPALEQASDAEAVLNAHEHDPQAAAKQFGRKVGVSRTSLYMLRAVGTIVGVDKKGVGVALRKDAKEPDVILQTGFLFGNTVRDATGLLDARNYPDSRHFTEISIELNKFAESRVIATLKEKAETGREIEFTGCAEIPDDAKDVRPLTIIPLEVRLK